MSEIQFRKLFVVEPSHDVSATKKYTSQVVFITSGEESIEEVQHKIEQNIKEFDPKLDAFIPMGRVTSCSIALALIGRKIPKGESVMMGVYRNESYFFVPVVMR
jgi:hypothetical protein